MLREVQLHTLFSILMVICLIAIAISKRIASKRFNDFISVIGNSNYLKIYNRDQKLLSYFDSFLFVNLIISSGIFCAICIEKISKTSMANGITIFELIIAIGVFFLAKILIERLVGRLFKINTIVDHYLFQKTSYKNYLGLLLLPINALLIYSFNLPINAIYGIVVILLTINLSGVITTFKAYQNEIKANMFYFILYLCALEIAPYIIIYSIISF